MAADRDHTMTEVAFYVHVPNPLVYAGRLVRKACQRGMSVWVLGQPGQVAFLDEQLWAMRPVEFLPHCRAGDAPGLLRRSSVVLAHEMAQLPERPFDALLNLGTEVPPGYQAFARIFEVVSPDEGELQAARRRWRAYERDGLAPKRHEIAA